MKKLLIAVLFAPLLALAQIYPSPTFNSLTLINPLTAANGGTGATTSTGSGPVVLGTSPSITNPTIAGANITGGAINGTPISGSTGSFTTLSATTANPSLLYNQGGTGSVTRSYTSKFGDTVSVIDFGGDATCTNDSTSAIQSAITYVLSLANGGAVYMPKGCYKVTSTINIPFTANVSFTLYGDGRATQLKYYGSAYPNILNVGGATNLFGTQYVFRDFSFAQPNSGTATGGNASIYFHNMNSALIDNVSFYNYANGLILDASYNTRVINSLFYGNSANGISTFTTGTNALYLDKNIFQANPVAVNLTIGGNNIVVRDNDFEGNGISVGMTSYTSVLIEGNYIENGTSTAFFFGGTNYLIDIRQNWLGANSVTTPIQNINGGSFSMNTLYNSAWTFSSTAVDVDRGPNDITGSATLGNSNFTAVSSFSNTWTGAGVGYKKLSTGLVELRGKLTAGSSSFGNTAFTLPVGYQPQAAIVIPSINTNGNSVCAIYISTSGAVSPSCAGGASGNVISIDGVIFTAN